MQEEELCHQLETVKEFADDGCEATVAARTRYGWVVLEM